MPMRSTLRLERLHSLTASAVIGNSPKPRRAKAALVVPRLNCAQLTVAGALATPGPFPCSVCFAKIKRIRSSDIRCA